MDILTTSGLLKEEGGTLIAVAPEPRPIAETVEKTLSILDAMSTSDNLVFERSIARASTRLGGVQINIDVTVQCTPADLEDLGRKLRKVLKDFNEPEPKEEVAPQPAPLQPPPTPPVPPAAPANEVAEEWPKMQLTSQTTAEYVMGAVEAVVVSGRATSVNLIAEFLGTTVANATAAVEMAVELGLLATGVCVRILLVYCRNHRH